MASRMRRGANASQHLQALRRAGLVTATRSGKYVRYRLADPTVVHVVEGLRRLAEQQTSELGDFVQGYLRDRAALEPVSQDELVARLKDRLVTQAGTVKTHRPRREVST